jgi:hypothetical protein
MRLTGQEACPTARYTSHMGSFDKIYEQFKVQGKDLAAKIHDLIHEGNVRRIVIKDESGHTFMEIPLTVAAIGVVAAPLLAAIGTIATMVAKFDIVVERNPPTTPPATDKPGPA